jgi:hypothetical protein
LTERCVTWLAAAEFNKITTQTALGFIVMGFIGFFVKLIFIVRSCTLGLAHVCRLFDVALSTSQINPLDPHGATNPNPLQQTGRRPPYGRICCCQETSAARTLCSPHLAEAEVASFLCVQPINQIIVGGSVSQ